MKAFLLILFLSIGLVAAADKPMPVGDAFNELLGPLAGNVPSGTQYDAFRELVSRGPEGWEKLFKAQFHTGESGDAARRIDSLWDASAIPRDLVERFIAAQRAEITRRAANESWALLYAGAYTRTAHRGRFESLQAQLDRQFAAIAKCLDLPAEALIQIAFLHVRLVETADFPGHRFPWGDTSEKQKVAIQGLLEWWTTHRDEFEPDEE